MIKVDITNIYTNKIGWSGTFSDSNAAQDWINQAIDGNWWGKPDRWINAETYTSADGLSKITIIPDEDVTKSDQNKQITLSDGTIINSYHFIADYTIVQNDITVQFKQQQAVQQALANQQIGALVIATVAALNEAKLAAGTMTEPQFQTMLADQNLLNIERLLWNGSLITAKNMIQLLGNTYYSSAEIQQILSVFP